jgi:prepilin-type N-terminal cleavage/methylation domain-containing protein
MLNQNKQKARSQGFTLVELSIVIIIIGFLIAGIAAGTSLIKQAEINSVVTDMQGFQTAYNNFLLRYNAVPGDMKNAETYWPAGGSTACAVTAGNCDGDGDGVISFNDTGSAPSETSAAWRQLALANMISAGIVVIPDSIGSQVVGSTVPGSKISGAGYTIIGGGLDFGVGGAGNISSSFTGGTNAVLLAKPSNQNEAGMPNSALKPENAFNLDKKIDDGSVNGSAFSGATSGNFRSVQGGDTGSNCISGANYDLTVTTVTCISGLALN